MGQKTHPTGFRIGVNKLHNSTWFANYGAYSKVLEEDYKIRKFFEKELESVYSKAGISNLEIKRKVNQFELLTQVFPIKLRSNQPTLVFGVLRRLTKMPVEKRKCQLIDEVNVNSFYSFDD